MSLTYDPLLIIIATYQRDSTNSRKSLEGATFIFPVF